jgi:oligosaccharide repeat unit polymerase
MRIGFHVGTFAFLLMYPLLFADNSGTLVSETTRWTIGFMLILTVVSFEGGYWLSRRSFFSPRKVNRVFFETARLRRRLVVIVFIGTGAWVAYAVALAVFLGTEVLDVLAAMRAPVEGAEREPGDLWRYVGSLAVGMLFLAAAAASALVARGSRVSPAIRVICWLVLLTVTGAGFISGSRVVFLYSLIPLAAAGWSRISGRGALRSIRWLWAVGVAGVLGVAWLAMSALRGLDIRYYQGGWERLAPQQHIEGAFDVYAQLAIVVESFPEAIDYQYGTSLVPLVFGWLPRGLWPDKPYPFSLLMNYLSGEDLSTRSASIAAGLPGEGYGNLGLFGVMIWALLMGLLCRRADDWLHRFDLEHPLGLQLAAMCTVWAAVIVRGGVPEMFYMGAQILTLPCLLVLYVSSGLRRTRPRALSSGTVRI